ncbi:hypothetical protein QEZ47_01865 [Aminobacter anthyllidis]|uniref:hypothetical protein n=1 Tax=Aminobacter anthyllidis TaxID=1035067 RepID=UPI002456787A|nr:hypothetical protein [Aminobacter anthyllidis]MDH4984331.1 hypothetical protein [Aminobacter anthyllidis]
MLKQVYIATAVPRLGDVMSEIELSEARELAHAMVDPEFTYTLDADEALAILKVLTNAKLDADTMGDQHLSREIGMGIQIAMEIALGRLIY